MQDRSAIVREFFQGKGFEESIIVTSSFRSGSSYFCSLLRSNGIKGIGNERLAYCKGFDKTREKGFIFYQEAVVDGLDPPLFTTKLM